MAAPLFPLTLAFCLGIILSKLVGCSTVPLLLASSFLVVASWMLFLTKEARLLTWVLLLAFLCMGVAWPPIHKASYGPNHLRNLVRSGRIDLSQPCRVTGICSKDSVQRGFGEQIELEVNQIENRYSVIPTQGKIRLALYYKRETTGGATPSRTGNSSNVPTEGRPGVVPPTDSLQPVPIVNPGDRVEILANLRQPKNFNDPGQFDYVAYLERQDVFLVGTVKNELLVTRIAAHQGNRPMTFVQELRANLNNLLDRSSVFSQPVRAALKALLLGEKQGLDPNVEQAFQASGIYHVLVVSGQHVAILSGFLLGLFTLVHLPRGFSIPLTMSALVLYCLITQSQPSIVRATLMTCTFLIVLTFDRDRNLLNSLSVAALLLLLTNPSWLFDAGFQLSFLAVIAIGVIGLPLLRRTTQPYRNALWQVEESAFDGRFTPALADLRLALRLRIESLRKRFAIKSLRLIKWTLLLPLYCLLSLAEVLLTSISVQAFFFVLMIIYFHRVSLISVLLNALVVPLVSLIVPLGFLFLALFAVVPWVSTPVGMLCAWLTQWLLTLAEYFANPAWGNYRIPTPPVWLVVIYFSCLLLLLMSSIKIAVRVGFAGLAVVTASLLLIHPFHPPVSRSQLQVTFLDVRQGDSIFLQFPDGGSMLIDGGGLLGRSFGEDFSQETFDVGEQVVSPFLWSKGLRELEVVALTHAHHDHIGGLDAILSNFQVRELWLGENPYTPEYVRLLKLAIRKGMTLRHFSAGDALGLHGAEIAFINPVKGLDLSHPASNNDSLAFQLRFGARTLLLMGDVEKKIEMQMMNRVAPLRSDVLKVAHHGSRSSTTEEFLRRVNPILAVISVAEHSPFGHPHKEVLERLAERSVSVFRTDHDGAICVRTDGRQMQVEPFLAPAQGASKE